MLELLIVWFEKDGWTIHRSGYRDFPDDPTTDDVIAERRDYDVTTINLTALARYLDGGCSK